MTEYQAHWLPYTEEMLQWGVFLWEAFRSPHNSWDFGREVTSG